MQADDHVSFNTLILHENISEETVRTLCYYRQKKDYFKDNLYLLLNIYQKNTEEIQTLLRKNVHLLFNIPLALRQAVKCKSLDVFRLLILSDHVEDKELLFYFELVSQRKLTTFMDFLYPLIMEGKSLTPEAKKALETAYREKFLSDCHFKIFLNILSTGIRQKYFCNNRHAFYDSGISRDNFLSGKVEIQVLHNIRNENMDAIVNIFRRLKSIGIPGKDLERFLLKIKNDLAALKSPSVEKPDFIYSLENILAVNAFALTRKQIDFFSGYADNSPDIQEYAPFEDRMLKAIKSGKLSCIQSQFDALKKNIPDAEFQVILRNLLDELAYTAEGNGNPEAQEMQHCENAIALLHF